MMTINKKNAGSDLHMLKSLQVWSILYVWSLILVLYEVTVEEHFRDENSQIFLGHMSSPSMVEKKKYSIREGIHVVSHMLLYIPKYGIKLSWKTLITHFDWIL